MSELAKRLQAALSLLIQAQDAVDDVFWAAEENSHLEGVAKRNDCKDLRAALIASARLDGMTNEQLGLVPVPVASDDLPF